MLPLSLYPSTFIAVAEYTALKHHLETAGHFSIEESILAVYFLPFESYVDLVNCGIFMEQVEKKMQSDEYNIVILTDEMN